VISQVKRASKQIAETVARGLIHTGVSPTQLTLTGFGLNLVVAATLGAGLLPLGGVLVLVVGLFDTLDGALARVSERSTRFGAFLDSTLDRYSEAAILLGLLFDAGRRGDLAVGALAFVVAIGSLMVSYARARAEGLGLDCEVGFAPRPERVVVLGLGLIVGLELPALVLLAAITHITAVQRIMHVYNLTRD